MQTWFQLSPETVLNKLGTSQQEGLTTTVVQERLRQYGLNQLLEPSIRSPWLILREQLTATMVLILLFAAAFSAALGDLQDAVAILMIVVFNALLGFRQEYQAERAIASLRKLAVPIVKVRRNKQVFEIPSPELVPGDIVLLDAGNLIPADGRILESANLSVQESALTGECEAVHKQSRPLEQTDLPLGDRTNMVYRGTMVTHGRGEVVITTTGMATELGQIAAAIQSVKSEPTHLQKRLDQLGRHFAIAILIIVLIVFGLGLLRGENIQSMFLVAVSLGVAAVPEGLPAVVTIALSLGAQRMLKQRALIRKLPAVETLGAVTVICTDKTGTLTENQMTVACLVSAGKRLDWQSLSSSGIEQLEHPALKFLLLGGMLCNDATLNPDPSVPQGFCVIGDPTEGALVVAAAQAGLQKADIEQSWPRIQEISFDSERKCMTTVHRIGETTAALTTLRSLVNTLPTEHRPDSYIAVCKGAIDQLLNISDRVWTANGIEQLTQRECDHIHQQHDQLAQEGLRLLGIAYRPLLSNPENIVIEEHLIFIGLVGMIDPIRSDVYSAIQTCLVAGIRPVMITGDHPLTAQHIGTALGITSNPSLLTGQELEQMTDLDEVVNQVSIYARVAPQHKLEIVHALQKMGHIVAMTGDGVNDAPALKQADIGIAMGITGTDVAKDAADIVLLNDNFSTIVSATREGRVIYDNIRKFIHYTLTGNLGEIWVILLAPFLGMPLPLLPLQILWINLLADGILALSLSVEPAEHSIMRRSPYQPNESIFSRGGGIRVIWIGLFLGFILLGVAYRYWVFDPADWQTMVFCTLAFSRIFIAQALRSERDSLMEIGLLSNPFALLSVLLTFVCQLAVIYVPALQHLFKTVPLAIPDLGLSLGLGALLLISVELEKKLRSRT
ncbi:cation-translocating P-type ATPase [Acaryochloris sp. IP29b_bin.148]|uniref:cation-translocating P-type ATPase n=1 Tax=Acaryochloris sp. IP29b_bin.148 TaxID=2969218 RepID=UPI002606D051|nr:cation-translocating P-type ATPase [Acaryochloris sp. IP29b_bin.148]